MKTNHLVRSAFLCLLVIPGLLNANYREAIGWDRLVEELGDDVPLGREIDVSLIEAPPFGSSYQPDTNNFEFSGKTFSMESGDGGVSSHATVVAQLFFGTWSSMARSIDTIDVYNANHWLFGDALRAGEEVLPAQEIRRIQNHSWTGTFSTNHDRNIETIRRFDYAIERDRFVSVVALSHNTGDVPALLAHSYNAIAVGNPNGNHNRGGTWFEGAGRVRPDLVTAGNFFASYPTPIVSSAVAILLEEADRTPELINARHNPQVIKSILMAGTAKGPDWSRSPEQPLDEIFGAGHLNLYRGHRILSGGEFSPDPETQAPPSGWHFGETVSGDGETYFFSFDRKQETFTVNLAWNRTLDLNGGTDFLAADILLARMELRLFEVNDLGLGAEIQRSNDPVNNIQHLYLEELPAGEYAVVVNRTDDRLSEDVAYALAWDAMAAVGDPPVRFADWRERTFSAEELGDPDISSPTADPDGDGIPNLLEYALGGDPRESDRAILPVEAILLDEGIRYVALTFTRPRDLEDVAYRVDASSDLTNWTEGAGTLIKSVENDDGTVTDSYRASSEGGRGFLRLTVSLQEEP